MVIVVHLVAAPKCNLKNADAGPDRSEDVPARGHKKPNQTPNAADDILSQISNANQYINTYGDAELI